MEEKSKYQKGGSKTKDVSNYSKRNIKKAKKLTTKADRREKYWSDYDKEMNEIHGEGNWTEGATRLFTGKGARKRAKIAENKADAGSRKAYRAGKKAGIYRDGGFLEPPTPTLFED